MPDYIDIPGITELKTHTKGDPRIKIALLDGPVDLDRACFQGSNLTKIQPYWEQQITIKPQDLETYLEIENSGDNDQTKATNLKAAIPDIKTLELLNITFHATHISSTIFGQPNSPVQGIAPNCTGFNIPIGFNNDNFISPINLSRAINLAIDMGANIIHIAACRPTKTGVADELLERALRQCQKNNILIIAPAGNDKGECWCIPAILPDVLAVGAMKDNGQPFKFSNWGGIYQQQGILAPGENILGAQPGTDKPIRKKGTSCAAPIVTAVSALLLSLQLQRGLSPDPESVRAAIINSAIPCDPESVAEPERCLLGKLNVSGALALLTGPPIVAIAPTSENREEVGEVYPISSQIASTNLNSEETPISEPSEQPINIFPPAPTTEIFQSLPDSQQITAAATTQVNTSNHHSTVAAPSLVNNSIAPSGKSNFVYVLGTLGYDFGTQARRDTFKQLMPAVEINRTQIPANPYDARQMVDYLEENLPDAASLIWTLNLELTPVYAIEPRGAFAADVYEIFLQMLAGQVQAETSEEYIERVSIPGRLTDRTVKLFSGQVVPVIVPHSPRGMYGWQVNTLVSTALAAVRKETQGGDQEQMRKSLASFLNRVYYDLRNLGQTSRDRALNFAATNAFQAASTFSEAVATGMELDSIEVETSPFCRLNSDCWDVKLKFFDPENSRRAKKVFRFTIDVSDLIPVTLGEVRSWSISS